LSRQHRLQPQRRRVDDLTLALHLCKSRLLATILKTQHALQILHQR
jgi:hypothetical protein